MFSVDLAGRNGPSVSPSAFFPVCRTRVSLWSTIFTAGPGVTSNDVVKSRRRCPTRPRRQLMTVARFPPDSSRKSPDTAMLASTLRVSRPDPAIAKRTPVTSMLLLAEQVVQLGQLQEVSEGDRDGCRRRCPGSPRPARVGIFETTATAGDRDCGIRQHRDSAFVISAP